MGGFKMLVQKWIIKSKHKQTIQAFLDWSSSSTVFQSKHNGILTRLGNESAKKES
jgi:hypothetical protein